MYCPFPLHFNFNGGLYKAKIIICLIVLKGAHAMQQLESSMSIHRPDPGGQDLSAELKTQRRQSVHRAYKGTGTPDLNETEEFQGVRFYKDTASENLWYYGPVKQPWNHSRSKIANHIIWNARLSLAPSVDTLAGFSESHPNCKLVAVSVTSENSSVEIAAQIAAPHRASVKVLSGIPYPLIIFSATLDMKDPDCEKIDETIKNGLEQGGLLTGELRWSFQASAITMDGHFVINMRQIADALRGQPGNEWILEKDFFRRLLDEIHTSLPSVLTISVGALSPSEIDIIESTLFSLCYPSMIADSKSQYVFDMKRKYTLYKLKDSAEHPIDPLLQKIRSTETVSHTLSLTV